MNGPVYVCSQPADRAALAARGISAISADVWSAPELQAFRGQSIRVLRQDRFAARGACAVLHAMSCDVQVLAFDVDVANDDLRLIATDPMFPPPADRADEGERADAPDVGSNTMTGIGEYEVALIRGDSIAPQAVSWIWDGWLAAGKFHVLAGAPGVGKSTIALALAATITSGGRWPDGTRATPGNVLIWSGEDDPADTLVPRLMAMGADMARIWFVGDVREGVDQVAFDPARHMAALELKAGCIGSVKLVIVDPVVSAVAGDSHRNAEVRRALQPLVDLAVRLDCGALGISHFSKGTAGRDPTERVTGSLAFGALARVVLVAAKTPANVEGTAGRVFARAKCNIGVDEGGFAYDIEQTELTDRPGLFASRVLWGEAIDGTARELLADAETQPDEQHGERAGAAAWLREVLAQGPVSSRQIKTDCDGAGFSWRTIQRAQKALGIVAKKEGMKGGWVWRLPDDDAPNNANIREERQPNCVATFDKFGVLRADDYAIEVEL